MATLKNLVDETTNIKNELVTCHTNLKNNLISKGVECSDSDKMSSLIDKVAKLTNNNAVYGVRVNETNSNPSTCVTYIEDSVGVNPATSESYGGWENKFPFNEIKPCGFKNGKVVKYINPNDFTKYVDGTSVDDDVDVMIEFPKIYWKFTAISNGYEVRICKEKIDDEYVCLAHTIGTRNVDYIYIGAYLGTLSNSKLRSIKGENPYVSATISRCRELAQANGTGYQQYNYYSMLMLQILYLIMYKSLNSQSSLGYGYTNGNATTVTTGNTYDKGMNYGEETGKVQMKFLGIEDFWGNVRQYVDGFFINSNKKILISDNTVFNNTGLNYEDCGNTNTFSASYFSKVCGGNKTGFVMKEVNGSSSTYYTDQGYLGAELMPVAGGLYSDNTNAGAFYFHCSRSSSSSGSGIGTRLVFLG